MGWHAQLEVNLVGRAATEHCRPDDQPSGLDALNVDGATAVFDYPIRTYPGAINRRDLSKTHRAFNNRARDRTNRRAPCN